MRFDEQNVFTGTIDRAYAHMETVWNCEPPRRGETAHRLPARMRLRWSLSRFLRKLADKLEQGMDGYRTDLPRAV